MAAAIYARISSDLSGQGIGVDNQIKRCSALIEAKGWTVGEIYTDNDISAYDRKKTRPSFERLLTDISEGRVEALVAFALDRLARQPKDLERLITACEEANLTKAVTIDGGLDLTTGGGQVMGRVITAFAAQESRIKSERLRLKAASIAAEGGVSGGGPSRPFGYTQDRRKLIPKEAKLIKQAAQDFIDGIAITAIVRGWTEKGVKTTMGKDWTHQSLRRMLKSGRIAGLREHHGEITATAVWPGIITVEMRDAILKRFEDPRHKAKRQPSKYLLTGLVYCGKCGQRMSSYIGERANRKYTCKRTPNHSNCGKRAQAAEPLEAYVVQALKYRLEGMDLAAKATQVEEHSVAIERLLSERGEIDSLRSKLAERLTSGTLTFTEWEQLRDATDARYKAIDADLKEFQQPPEANEWMRGRDLSKEWDSLDFDRQRLVLREVIDTISLGDVVLGRNFFQPERVRILWRV